MAGPADWIFRNRIGKKMGTCGPRSIGKGVMVLLFCKESAMTPLFDMRRWVMHSMLPDSVLCCKIP